MKQLISVAMLAAFAWASTGCLMAGNYHSAKTVGKGNSSFGLTFSATTFEFDDAEEGDVDRIAVPNIIPELAYHVGVTDDVEVGGRVGLGSLAIEGDVKVRFFKSPQLHLAVAPALAYQSLIVIQGLTARLPVIATYDVNEHFGFTAAVFGSTTSYSEIDPDEDDDDEFGLFSGSWVASGASVGVELRGATMQIRPAIEFTQYLTRFDDGNDDTFNTVSLTVHIAFIGGQEKQQLDRIENKLDSMGR